MTKDELIAQVNKELIGVGNMLKKNLWTQDDKKVVLQRAVDLVNLQIKTEEAADPKKKKQYRLAAQMVLQHIQSMALLKMLIAQEETLQAIKNLLWDLLTKILIKNLPALVL